MAQSVQYVIIGDFVPCPQCQPHLGADHQGGIEAPMSCMVPGCGCVLNGPNFQILTESTPTTTQGTDEKPV
jgi:hypothetical protein